MKLEMFDVVELTDGRRGTIVDVLKKPRLAYVVELKNSEHMEISDAMPIVTPEQIKVKLNKTL